MAWNFDTWTQSTGAERDVKMQSKRGGVCVCVCVRFFLSFLSLSLSLSLSIFFENAGEISG